MNVFKMQNDENKLYFANYDRIDENIIFKNALERLKENSSFSINKASDGVLEDVKECTMDGYQFSLIYDIDYGTFVHSSDKKIIDKLERYFNS